MLEHSILLIGIGTNKYKLNEIVEVTEDFSVLEKYGEQSCFYKAWRIWNKFNKPGTIYILNLDSWENISNQDKVLNDLNFDYICPLDLYLDDSYYDDYYAKRLFYSQLILLLISKTISTVIMTGQHATGFEDLDSFLNNENEKIERAMIRFSNLKRENFIYVANNLTGYIYANVVLACSLINTDYAEYPVSDLFGPAYFEIDQSDVSSRLVYFKNNYITGTTVENLVNFSSDYTLRLVPVYRIIKYFYFHQPDQDEFIGKTYSEYRKLKIKEKLDEFLSNLKGWIIYKYEIVSVTDIQTELGTIDIRLRYNIWPKFTTEVYRLENML